MRAYLSAILVLSVLASGSLAEPPTRALRLKAGTFDPSRDAPSLPDALTWKSEPRRGVFVLQLEGAGRRAAEAATEAAGGEVLGYLPDSAWLVRVPEGGAARLRAEAGVRWVGALEPGWKLAPDLGLRDFESEERRKSARLWLVAELFRGSSAEDAAAKARSIGAEVLRIVRIERPSPHAALWRLHLRADLSQAHALARVPEIAWIEDAAEITSRNDDSAWVLQSNVQDSWPLWDRGLHGQGQIVGLIDEPLDMSSCFFRDESDNTPGPGHRKVIAYRSSSGIGAAEHGTHVGGTLAGDRLPAGGTGEWGGMAPAAKISFWNLFDISGGSGGASNVYEALSDAYGDGARIHNNSWGDDSTNAYTVWSRDIDMFAYDHEESLVVQAGTNLSSSRSPENAKNGLSIGASKRAAQAHERCHGSIGPTIDGRRKPELLAPGCFILSARAWYSCSTFGLDGTSMATPAVAGVGALVRQYYQEGWYPSGSETSADTRQPSGTLVKATLLNASVDMTGEEGYPSNEEGWGRPLAENALYFAGDTRRLSVVDDVLNAEGLSQGGSASYAQTVHAGDEPLKITLVWTEPPAEALAAEATINDLDLEVVSPSGTLYLGNVIDTATGLSMSGGAADPRNNVEMVIVSEAEAGRWTLRVRGSAINEARQGYALVVSGDVEPYVPYPLEHVSHGIDDSLPFGNQDGIADPGETLVMSETLRNTGEEFISAITGALRVAESALVKITRDDASYPGIPSGGSATSNAPHYRYTVSPDTPCGTQLSFDLALSSSAGDGGTGFVVEVGCNPLSCPDGPAPGEEVSGLMLEKTGSGDLQLSWSALAGAAAYRVWKAAAPTFESEDFVDSTTATLLVEAGGASGPETWFFQVRATNSCEWEGP